jgi:DNA repair exonuclease SbcCD ATPase subunit
VVEEHFQSTGDFRRLIELADQHGAELPKGAVRWARWARSFRQGDFAALGTELGRQKGAAETFLLLLGQDSSTDRQGKLLEFLQVAEELESLSSDRLRGLARDIEERLAPTLEEVRQRINGLADPAQWDDLVVAPSTEEGSVAQIDIFFADLRAHLRRTLEETQQIDQQLRPLAGRRFQGALRGIRDLREQLERLEDRFQEALEQVETLDHLRKRAVAAGEARGGWDELRGVLRNIDQASLPPLLDLRRLLAEYFKGYEEVHEICDHLMAAYRQGGEGLSEAELAALRQRLEQDLVYSTEEGADRFRIDRYLPRPYTTLIQEVTLLVAEVEAVRSYQQQMERAAGLLTLLEDRLRRYRQAGSDSERAAEVGEIRHLLHQSLGEFTIFVAFRRKPDPKQSEPAQKRLAELKEKPWYRRLQRAVRICEGGVG